MKELLNYLNNIHPMSPALQAKLSEMLESSEVSKKQLVLREGERSNRIYFISSGIFRCYYTNDEGKEICSWFMRAGDVIISVESFFKQIPSYENIQALEDSNVFSITFDQLQAAYQYFPEFNIIGRRLTEQYYCQSEQRLFWLRCNKAVERYKLLLDNYPWIIQQVANTHIASFLGISLETLSRLKHEK